MTAKSEKRRPRRIAADEAHAWARSLRLNNPNAKSVLRALAFYVNGDGECYVGLDQLSDDTDLSADTVRRRIVWLEQVGAIIRKAQWIDNKGIRNGEGRGKRTTDLIRLLVDVDPTGIELRAAGSEEETEEISAISEPISPSQQQGLNSDQPSVSPPLALAVVQGTDSLNHEPESPSKSPPRGNVCEDASLENGLVEEPEHFAEFWSNYPNHEVMSRHRALEMFLTMTPDEQRHARAAVAPLRDALFAMKRRPKDAHKWLAEKGWREFPDTINARNVVTTSSTFDIASPEAKALTVVHDICGLGAGFRKIFVGKDKLVRYKKPMTARILAFASVPPHNTWLKPTAQQAQAWTAFFREVAALNLLKRIDTRDLVPWPWPPKQDGTIYTATGPPPALTTHHETDDEMAENFK